jgi:hypothetical protein
VVEDGHGDSVGDQSGDGPGGQAEGGACRGHPRLVDEVEGQEDGEDVADEVGEVEQRQRPQHGPIARGADDVSPPGDLLVVLVGLQDRDPRCGGHAHHEQEGDARDRHSPAATEDHDAGVEQGACDDADRAGQGPPRHERLAARRVGVDEHRLGERDERAGCGEEEDEGGEQHGEGRGGGHGHEGGREREAPAQDQPAAVAPVCEDAEGDLDEVPQDGGDGEEGTDLPVRQVEVGADRREGGTEHAPGQLVEQLDEQQGDDEARRAPDARHVSSFKTDD